MMPAPLGVVTNWIEMNSVPSDRLIIDSNLADSDVNAWNCTTNVHALNLMRSQIEEVFCDVEEIIHNEYEYGFDTYRLFDQAITEVNSIIDNFSKATNSISDRKVNLSPTVQ